MHPDIAILRVSSLRSHRNAWLRGLPYLVLCSSDALAPVFMFFILIAPSFTSAPALSVLNIYSAYF